MRGIGPRTFPSSRSKLYFLPCVESRLVEPVGERREERHPVEPGTGLENPPASRRRTRSCPSPGSPRVTEFQTTETFIWAVVSPADQLAFLLRRVALRRRRRGTRHEHHHGERKSHQSHHESPRKPGSQLTRPGRGFAKVIMHRSSSVLASHGESGLLSFAKRVTASGTGDRHNGARRRRHHQPARLVCTTPSCARSWRQRRHSASSCSATCDASGHYSICCLGVFPLRSRNVTSGSAPFVAPGRALAPLGAWAIIVWMLSTLPVKELGAAASMVAVSGLAYTLQRFGQRASAHRAMVAPTNTAV